MNKDRLLEFAAVAAEALWVYAIVTVIIAAVTEGSGPSALALIAIALGGFYAARLMLHLDWPDVYLMAFALALTLLGLYAVLRLDYTGDLALYDLGWLSDLLAHPGDYISEHNNQTLGLIAASGLWLRSALRGRERLSRESIILSFSLGFIVIVIAALLAPAADAGTGAIAGAALGFFACGLLALGFSRIMPPDQVATGIFRHRWTMVPVATVAAILLVAGPAWLLASAHISQHLTPVSDGLSWLVERIFFATVAPILQAIEWIIRGLIDLLASGGQSEQSQRRGILNFLEELRKQQQGQERQTPEFLIVAGRVVVALIFVAPIAWLFYSAFRRLRRLAYHGGELRERISIEGGDGNETGGRLGRLLSRLHWRGRGEPDLPEDVLAVRRLYLTMLERAAHRGLHREPPGRTPLEFAPDLERHFASGVPGEISRIFTAARYGLQPPSHHDLERLRREWEETSH